MPNKKFLEEHPLYRKFEMEIPATLGEIPKPSIHMDCPICRSEQTFTMIGDYYELSGLGVGDGSSGTVFDGYSYDLSKGAIVRSVYSCAGCDNFKRVFMLKFDENARFVRKIGQYTPWDIRVDKNISKMLKHHTENYKKGLICESQSYGIGAYAYYRRIIEEIIVELLESIHDLLNDEEREAYYEALQKTKETIIAKEKIALVKDLLPTSLRPNNMNPLTVLHKILSEGIHAKSDEECLAVAATIRGILLYLVNQVIQAKESSKTFTDSMKKLLEKKK